MHSTDYTITPNPFCQHSLNPHVSDAAFRADLIWEAECAARRLAEGRPLEGDRELVGQFRAFAGGHSL